MTDSPARIRIVALYEFKPIADPVDLRERIFERADEVDLKGTLLVASEGINGTVAGASVAIDRFLVSLREEFGFDHLTQNLSWAESTPFLRLKVKLKREIVTLGVADVDPAHATGEHVGPERWDSLLDDPEVTVLDTRNDYEVAIGTFENAVNVETTNFREFPDFVDAQLDPEKHKKVAMFCTGGIRCEKASAYLLSRGFQNVYQLEGGILRYLREVDPAQSKWHGECFVFDERVAVDHDLAPGAYQQCFACRRPLGPDELQSPAYEIGVSCPYCIDEKSDADRQRYAERHRQVELAEQRNDLHLGASLDSPEK